MLHTTLVFWNICNYEDLIGQHSRMKIYSIKGGVNFFLSPETDTCHIWSFLTTQWWSWLRNTTHQSWYNYLENSTVYTPISLFVSNTTYESESVSCSVVSNSLPSHWLQPARLLSQARILPFPSPGDLPNPGIKPGSPTTAGRFFAIWATEAQILLMALRKSCLWL